MHIVCLQHEPHETPGAISVWARENGHTITIRQLYSGDTFPDTEGIDVLLVMGGSMGVGDERLFPWLKDEKYFIEQCIAGGKKTLGICLGAQLIAAVLGARVFRNRYKEIGWFPVALTDQGKQAPFFTEMAPEFPMFHWHGDTFDLPRGACHLACSEATEQQAFLVEDCVLGLQFHPEMDQALLDDFVTSGGGQLVKADFVQTPEEIMAGSRFLPALRQCLFRILNQLTGMRDHIKG
jgi:GMP synthase-like glutamine amidotransferase